ncbi:hypothetical protein T439DRAFT_327861 [Meredithblackwellia eburnea MCA 4105]
MFASTLQPSLLSIFSSTNSQPLLLASSIQSSCSVFEVDSFVSLLDDSSDGEEVLIAGTRARKLKGKGSELDRGNLDCKVLHIQSPDVKGTWVQWGKREDDGLGIKLPLLVLQLKDLGQVFMLEVGVSDSRGQKVRIRGSTFQTEPKAYQSKGTSPPLLHLPLSFPTNNPSRLTPWCSLTLHLPHLLSSLTRVPSLSPLPQPAPFQSIDYIRIHANCRLRRVYFAEEGEGGEVPEAMVLRGMRSELGMFESENLTLS